MTYWLKNEDCIDFLESIPSDSIDLILIDPPYFIGYDGGSGWDSQWKTEKEYLDWCQLWTAECERVLKPNRMLIVWGTTKTDTFYRYKLEVLNKTALIPQNSIIWSYNWGGRGKKNFAHKHETAWCYSKGKEFLFNPVYVERKQKTSYRTGKPLTDDTIPTSVWEGNFVTVSKEAKNSNFHPTVKPQFILDRLIRAYSNETDLVLDCFSGSGSTMIAAVNANRSFIGCELSKEYYEKSLSRFNQEISVLMRL